MDMEETIKKIENMIFIYKPFICPDYPELGIYSDQYSKEVIFNIYSNTTEKKNFCYTYFDFDKLSVINEVHGKEIGDSALRNALKIIKHCLPSKSLLGRIGGDEFYIITPNATREEVENLYSKINSSLAYYSSKVYGLTVTFDSESSIKNSKNNTTSYRTLDELSKVTEKHVSLKKVKDKRDLQNIQTAFSDFFIKLPVPNNISSEQAHYWKTLNSNINTALKNHLRDLRPSNNFRYTIEDFKTESISIISAINDILELKINDKKVKKPNLSFSIDYDTAKLIQNVLSNNASDNFQELSDEQLTALDSSLSSFLEALVRDSHSGLLSKPYYNLFLANKLAKSNKSYQFTYFSISGIRPSNSAYGHSFTDKRIKDTSKELISAVSKRKSFNNVSFTFDDSNTFLLDQGGGNYMLIIPQEVALSHEEIAEITNEVNLRGNINVSNSTFMVASTHEDNVSINTIPNLLTENEKHSAKKPFVKYARHLKGTCNNSKDILKEKSLSGIDNMIAFRKSIINCCDYYLNFIDNADDINTKRFFLHNIFMGLINQETFYNKEAADKENNKTQDSDFCI